jgi:hypothetical protein
LALAMILPDRQSSRCRERSIFRQSLCVKELPVIYGEQAAAFMEFVSAEYEARDWTPG